jgi:imidazolonepropionase-like amidohydrolase
MGTQGVINSLRAGVNTIEHGNGLTEELAAQMAKQGTYLVPTLSITYSMAYRGERWKTPQSVVEFARGELPGLMAGVRMARDAGVKIAAGTDPPRLDTVPMECAVLVEAGLTPMEAIVAATLRGAEILGKTDDFGTVRPGRRADLAAYGANPLDDIAVLERAEFVMKDGTVERDDPGRAATVT